MMKDKRFVIGIAALLALVAGGLFLASTRKSSPAAQGPAVRHVYAADASAWLDIPADALPDGVKASDITITKADASAITGTGAPLVVYDLQPDGLQFKQPIKLSIKTIAWDDTVPELVLLGAEGNEPIDGTVASIDARDKEVTVRGEISHFSKYALVGGIFHVVSPTDPGNFKIGESFKVPFKVYYKTVNIKDSSEVVGAVEYHTHDVKTVEGDPKVSGVYQLDTEVAEPQRVTKPDNQAMDDTEFTHEETFTCKTKGYFQVHLDVSFMYKYKWTETEKHGEESYDSHKDTLVSKVGKAELVLHGSCGQEWPIELVKVLVVDRAFYPLKQFHLAAPDACQAPHWHAGARVYGVDRYTYKVLSAEDPAPKACGFGAVSDVATAWAQMPKTVQEEMEKARAKDAEPAR